jgi:hypothetical protein
MAVAVTTEAWPWRRGGSSLAAAAMWWWRWQPHGNHTEITWGEGVGSGKDNEDNGDGVGSGGSDDNNNSERCGGWDGHHWMRKVSVQNC